VPSRFARMIRAALPLLVNHVVSQQGEALAIAGVNHRAEAAQCIRK
jgi:hypothetical protein